jgi:hypothetical protein
MHPTPTFILLLDQGEVQQIPYPHQKVSTDN